MRTEQDWRGSSVLSRKIILLPQRPQETLQPMPCTQNFLYWRTTLWFGSNDCVYPKNGRTIPSPPCDIDCYSSLEYLLERTIDRDSNYQRTIRTRKRFCLRNDKLLRCIHWLSNRMFERKRSSSVQLLNQGISTFSRMI